MATSEYDSSHTPFTSFAMSVVEGQNCTPVKGQNCTLVKGQNSCVKNKEKIFFFQCASVTSHVSASSSPLVHYG